jgi:hypothetical protein
MITSIMVSIIFIAIATMLVTRPGASNTIGRIFGFGSSSIKGMLGTS